jgi:hypothetical protein
MSPTPSPVSHLEKPGQTTKYLSQNNRNFRQGSILAFSQCISRSVAPLAILLCNWRENLRANQSQAVKNYGVVVLHYNGRTSAMLT